MECKYRYEIFISSTIKDLKDERRMLINEINKMGHIPIAMELFYAENKAPWDVIKDKIRLCDYYILILSDKYGSICEELGNENSYTHEEFLLAKELHKPMLVFLRDKESISELPQEYKEKLYRKKLNDFIESAEKYLSSYWKNDMELLSQFQRSLNAIINEEPQRGWIRGTLPEIIKLRKSLNENKPIIYLTGADSVGKSTIALRLKNRYKFDSVVGVDVLRSGIAGLLKNQAVGDDEIKRILTGHSSVLNQEDIDKRSRILFEPIMAMVDRLHHKRYSAIIEGVDISPYLLFEKHRIGRPFDVSLNICISDEEEHIDRYNERARNTEGSHQSSLEKFNTDIRARQEKLIEEIEIIRKNPYFDNRMHRYYNIYNDGDLEETIQKIDNILFGLYYDEKRSQ